MMEGLPHQLSFKYAVLMLPIGAILGAALGVLRPIRRSLVPRSSHVIQTQVLLAVVGTAVMIIVANSLAREHAFRGKAVHYQLWASSPDELRDEVSVPFDQDIKKLARIIKRLDGRDASVEWEIKKFKTVRT